MTGDLAAFVGVSAVVIVTPGPDTALTVRNTLWGGRRSGLLTAAGVASGQTAWALATAVGVAALLRASEPAFVALRLVGSAYLVYLGAHALWAALRGSPPSDDAGAQRRAGGRSFRQGVLSNLSNPKMGVFFLSLLPQFAGSGRTVVLLGLLFAAMTLTWLAGYAWAVARAGDLLRRGRARRILDAFTGTVLVALGVRLATERT